MESVGANTRTVATYNNCRVIGNYLCEGDGEVTRVTGTLVWDS